MVSTGTSFSLPGIGAVQQQLAKNRITDTINQVRNSGYGASSDPLTKYASNISARNRESSYYKYNSQSGGGTGYGDASEQSSSGEGITSMDDAGESVLGSDGTGTDGGVGSDGTGGTGSSGPTSPLLQGDMSFEELIAEICDGLDLVFVLKRSTVVVTDYESLYAEAKYLRDNYHDSVKSEDMALWQLEEGSYELDVAEYGFYNVVKVKYKNGTVEESYEDLVRVYGKVVAEYEEPDLDKSSAIMKAKAYLAAHVRDFEMTVKCSLLHDGDIDIGDIVTIDNPMTLRDKYRKETEGRDPEYFFVSGNSISWDGDSYIRNDIEMRYGAKSPKRKEVPETGSSGYSSGGTASSGNIEAAIDEVGKMAAKIKYSSACQTHDCVQQQGTGDCFGMSDFIGCELIKRGVSIQIKGYPTFVSEHRSVLYKDASGNWARFPYRKYGVDTLFNDTDGVNSGHNVACTCDGASANTT